MPHLAASSNSQVNCIDCQSPNVVTAYVRQPKDNNYVFSSTDSIPPGDDRYVILRCSECGSIFLHPAYWEESSTIYNTERYHRGYFPNNIHQGGGPNLGSTRFPTIGRWRFRRRARKLLKLAAMRCTPGFRVLDIGCATGQLVRGFNDLGCDAYGVDVSKPAIDNACDKRLNLHLGPIETADFPGGFFDLIVSIETFEHLGPLDTTLQHIRRELKPDGRLIIQVPNDIDSYRARFYRRIWWMVPPMHIRYFTQLSISRIFGSHGFIIEHTRTTGGFGMDLRMMLSWALKRIGLHLPVKSLPYRISAQGIDLLFKPVDWFLNSIKRQTEIMVVLSSRA